MQVKVVPVPRQVLPFYTSAEIFSHCIISAALQCTSKLDALALPPTQTRPGQDFTISRPRCVEKVKSAPLENLGEIRVAGEEWRYPQQFCLNTNWTLLSGAFHSSQTPRQPRWGWGSSQSSWWLWSAMHWANEANNDQGYLEELQLSCCLPWII